MGYLVSSSIFRRMKSPGIGKRGYLIAAMAGAVAPDLDLLYFYLIDNRQHRHHSYWTHYPSLWICLLLVSLTLWNFKRGRAFISYLMIFSLNGFIHMVLDSIASEIHWFAPVSHQAYGLMSVTARYQPWWLNYILHWTFLAEITLVLTALVVWCRRVKESWSGW